jgi:Holliday junction resolvase RusA-like endonuclease
VIQITIPGAPVAKKRPRFARRGKFVTTYNEQETDEGFWALQAIRQIPADMIPITGPVLLDCVFSIPRPKSHFGKRGLKPSAPAHHTQKPDVDNYTKFVMDVLNRCGVWSDDCQVVRIRAKKQWADVGSTTIHISRDA